MLNLALIFFVLFLIGVLVYRAQMCSCHENDKNGEDKKKETFNSLNGRNYPNSCCPGYFPTTRFGYKCV